MAVVSVAMTLSFQLNQQPSKLERQIAKPLGIAFWLLSVVTLFMGLGNRIEATVNKYGQKAAIVQTGWKTQLVSADHSPLIVSDLFSAGSGCTGLVHHRDLCHSPHHRKDQPLTRRLAKPRIPGRHLQNRSRACLSAAICSSNSSSVHCPT